MASNENTARKPTMFGNFDIQETVGQGGMGIVYRARDITLGRDVALKVLKDELRENSKVVARFRREAEAIASLDHPRIVQVYSVGAVGNIPYFAMELIEGKPLNRVLRRHKFLQWKPALRVARDIAEALAAAHQAGIIHRDIKPGNILIDRSGNAFVTDFGIAKVLAAETQLTVDGSKLGTPQYMSPERVQNGEITAQSDIYSLGVVLFQMITGKLPYDAHDPIELIRMIVIDPPKRVRDYSEDASEDIERLVAYMLEKKPQDRPRSAAHVVELINRLLDGKPLFDSDSGVDDAFEDLREEISTPYSDSTGDLDASRTSRWTVARRRVFARWNAFPQAVRTGIIALAAIAAAFAAGMAVSSTRNADTAPEIANSFSLEQSAWDRQADLVRFVQNGVASTTVEFLFDEFRIAQIGWSQDGAVLVELRSGQQRALCEVRTDPETAWLLAPLGAWSGSDSLARYTSEAASAVIARASDGADIELFEARVLPFSAPVLSKSIIDRVWAYSAEPGGDRLLTGRKDGRDGRVIQEWTLDSAGSETETLFTSQQELRGLQYSLDGSGIAFQEAGSSGIETNVFVRDGDRFRLTLGDVTLASGALNPACRRFLILEMTASQGTALVVVDSATGSRIAELGEAIDASWVSADGIALLSPDESGEVQVWRVDLSAGPGRRQISFVKGGVEPRLSVRPSDGTIVVANVVSTPAAIQIIAP